MMKKQLRWLVMSAGVALLATVTTLGGCAAEWPARPAGLEQRIENARSRADHEVIASQYEQQAGVDKAMAEKHQGYARIYRKSGYAPRGGGGLAMSGHCESVAKIYQQAADENLALAKQHREMAAEAK